MAALFVLLAFIGSFAFVLMVPSWVRRAHVRAQNSLLDRCRALYMVGEAALLAGDRDKAKNFLGRIRRIEARWRYGNSRVYRVTKAMYAIALGIMGYVVLRYGILYLYMATKTAGPMALPGRLLPDHMLYLLIGVAMLHAVFSYYGEWVDPWTIDDCGDRLQRLLDAGVAIEVVPPRARRSPPNDGLSPREMFAHGPHFTRRELDKARRRLARELHPDRWQGDEEAGRSNAEEAMNRVNAAYDAIRGEAR